MKICIVFRKEKIADPTAVNKVADDFRMRGAEVLLTDRYSAEMGADVLFVLGGDGMVLHSALTASGTGAKIIGVNYGHLGFLTEFEGGEVSRAIDLVLSGNYDVLKRSVLQIECGGKTAYALNELSVNRDPMARGVKQMVDFSVRIEGLGKESFIADGVIVCTPTGSTAYSLSAGGSIVTPDSPVFMVTPVCSFSLNSRPIVFPDSREVIISPARETDKCVCFADGKAFCALSCGEELTVKKAPFTADFITVKEHPFLGKLTKKISD